ncbi:MAG: radical SAM protein, partial [Rhodospirillales bacterium]|nr:radical SAM protein [Rhodospirillales bacterium]
RAQSFTVKPLARVFAEIERAAREWPRAHRIFLADGDALALPAGHLAAICDRLAQAFPHLQRISCYATPVALLRKTEAELRDLRRRKLSLVYLGIESGSDDILRRIAKGATQRSIAAALDKARDAGIKVSATVILGLGGQTRWQDHIDGTAALVNRASPAYLSTLQLMLAPESVRPFLARFGEPFQPQDDDGILREQKRLLENLAPPRPVIFRSNHASNCLALAGTLPKDQARLAAELDEAIAGRKNLRARFLRGL